MSNHFFFLLPFWKLCAWKSLYISVFRFKRARYRAWKCVYLRSLIPCMGRLHEIESCEEKSQQTASFLSISNLPCPADTLFFRLGDDAEHASPFFAIETIQPLVISCFRLASCRRVNWFVGASKHCVFRLHFKRIVGGKVFKNTDLIRKSREEKKIESCVPEHISWRQDFLIHRFIFFFPSLFLFKKQCARKVFGGRGERSFFLNLQCKSLRNRERKKDWIVVCTRGY